MHVQTECRTLASAFDSAIPDEWGEFHGEDSGYCHAGIESVRTSQRACYCEPRRARRARRPSLLDQLCPLWPIHGPISLP